MLSLEPENTAAIAGYERLFGNYLELASAALAENRFELAEQHLEKAQILGVHPEQLVATQGEVAASKAEWERVQDERRQAEEAEERLQAERQRQNEEQLARVQAEREKQASQIESLLVEAQGHVSALCLTSPTGANAFASYVAVLELAPDDEAAVAGLAEIAGLYRGLARKAAADGQYQKALGYLSRAMDRFETGVPAEISPRGRETIERTVSNLRVLRDDVRAQASEAERIAAEQQRQAKEKEKEAEEEERRRRAAEEAERLAALIRERDDLERQQKELELAQQQALANEQVLNAKRARYEVALSTAQRAEDALERDLAISKYSEALSIFPGDPVANNGLARVRDPAFGTCGAVVGDWRYSTGGLVTLGKDGSAKHDLVVFNATGTWECVNPARREIKITWNTGFIDLLTFVPGTGRLEGKNTLGLPVWGNRE